MAWLACGGQMVPRSFDLKLAGALNIINWEAFIAIGGVTLIIGIVLLIPGLWWVRRNVKQYSHSQGTMAVTKAGFIYSSIFVFILVAGFTAQYWAPETAFGKWLSTGIGRILFVIGLISIAFIFEKILNKFGLFIKVLEKRK